MISYLYYEWRLTMKKGEERSIVMIIILSILTCGIYYFYWIYATSSDIKDYLQDDSINPFLDLILSLLTCGIYFVYWHYKIGGLIVRCYEKSGKSTEDNSILCTILAIFLYIAAGCIYQSQLNDLWNDNNVTKY